MTEALAHVLKAAEALSPEDQEILVLHLDQRPTGTDEPQLTREECAEIERRAAEVDRGEVELIDGDEVAAYVREIVEAARRQA